MKVSILGVTGIVGSKLLEMLSKHPYFEVNHVYASRESENKKIRELIKIPDYNVREDILEKKIESLDVNILKDDSLIFLSSLPSDTAMIYEKILKDNGRVVITNSSAFRMDPQVPILIPEINRSHLGIINKKGYIVANGNCTTIGLSLAISPLKQFGIKRLFVTTAQSISGAGYPGVPSMDILGNVIPFIENEETKLDNETKKIFGEVNENRIDPSNIDIFSTTMRVPTKEGHLGSVTVEIEKDVSLEEIEEDYIKLRKPDFMITLPTAPDKAVILRKEKDRPQVTLDSNAGSPENARGMAVVVGRLRKKGKFVSLVYVVNNLVRGAAGSAILNAELVLQEGMV